MSGIIICAQCSEQAAIKGLCRKHYKTAWAAKWRKSNKEKAKEIKREWEKANREKINAARRESYQRRKEKENEQSRLYYQKQRLRILAKVKTCRSERSESARKWRKANPEKVRFIANKWRKNNPEKSKEARVSRRARKQNAEGTYTAEQVRKLFELQRGHCAICACRLPKRFHEDHIVPLAKGGSNWIENIQLTCAICNIHKHAKDPIKFMQERGFLL